MSKAKARARRQQGKHYRPRPNLARWPTRGRSAPGTTEEPPPDPRALLRDVAWQAHRIVNDDFLTGDLPVEPWEYRGVAFRHSDAPVIDITRVQHFAPTSPFIRIPWPGVWFGKSGTSGMMIYLVTDGSDHAIAWAWWLPWRTMRAIGPVNRWTLLRDGDGRLAHVSTLTPASPAPILGVLDLLECRNIEVVPVVPAHPYRPPHGNSGLVESIVRIKTGGTRPAYPPKGRHVEQRLHSVRGHVAHYGHCCPDHEPRGLLFGKYQGRVWVPQHARGSPDIGETLQIFEID